MIHPSAIIAPSAQIQDNVAIGPYCVIGDHTVIGAGCELKSHVVIDGHTEIGRNNLFYPFAAIGQTTQDLKYQGEPTFLKIGDNNTFRENTTIHRSTSQETPTLIGNDNLFLAYSHIAHDCQVGNHCIFSNNGTIAGHVIVEDYAILSGLSAVHQFCRIGTHSIIGGCAKIVQDVPPYTITDGNPAQVRGINFVGIERRGFTKEDSKALRHAYRKLFLNKEANMSLQLSSLKEHPAIQNPHVSHLIDFIEGSERGVIR